MINLLDFQKTRKRWNCFSQVDILGSFDFYTLSVSLDSLTPKDVDEIKLPISSENENQPITMTEYERLKKVLPLAAHEFTHYLDGTATLWGMEHLSKINSASEVSLASEKDFYRLKSLYDHVRRMRLPNYYTTIDGNVDSSRPWLLHMTSGREFSSEGYLGERPILFGRFFNSQKQAIARSPISIISLLETSAMAEELSMRISLAKRLDSEKVIEEKLISNEVVTYIYNPNLTEYSVCAHIVANSTNCSDIFVAFKMSAFIARFILNATAKTFEIARLNLKNWADFMGLKQDSQNVTSLRYALKHKNHGALYYMLAVALPKNPEGSPTQFASGFHKSLSIVGIKFTESLAMADREFKQLAKKLETSPLETLRLVAKSSLENFIKMDRGPLSRPIDKLNLPPVFLGDLSQHQFKLNDNSLHDFDLEESYEELVRLQLRAENLAEACL